MAGKPCRSQRGAEDGVASGAAPFGTVAYLPDLGGAGDGARPATSFRRSAMRTLPLSFLAVSLLALSLPDSVAAQSPPVPVYPNLGDYARVISTSSPAAQQYFDQGIRLTYGFGHAEAVRSFREAIRQDSTCAMCWWGVAWARGPYINARMDSASAVEAYAAVRRALRLTRHATEVERALIDAMAARYTERPVEERAALDSAYMRAMARVVERYPDDLDAATLYAEALMVLRPWDQWTRAGEPKPGTERVLAALESVLERDVRHPGACHLYIHAVEASREPERAERCADFLGARIPGASHIPHMPSHIYMRIGRYGDAVVANRHAWHVDQQAAHGGPPGIYPSHNLHMMMTAAAFDGQSAVALQAARDLARDFRSNAFYPAVMLVRFGRWREALELEPPDSANRLQRGIWHFARGYGLLGTGALHSARSELIELDTTLARTPEDARFRGHSQRDLLGIARALLGAEISVQEGDPQRAVQMLEAALPLEDSLRYDEPEPWPLPLRHTLGAILLEAGDAPGAEAVHREALRDHPRNGWSLFGLEQALRAQGRDAEADAIAGEFATAWQRADVWLQGSRFPPRPAQPAPASAHHD